MEKVPSKWIQDKFKIGIMKQKHKKELIKAGFKWGNEELFISSLYPIKKAIGFAPQGISLVIINSNTQCAIGNVTLSRHSDQLYSIKFVYVDPEYRGKGLASKLLNRALFLLKKAGVKKIHLNVDFEDTSVINLYKKLGFKEFGFPTLIGYGYLSKYPHFRIIAHTLMGKGYFLKYPFKTRNIVPLNLNLKKNREKIFQIYEKTMGIEWSSFFDNNISNILNGYLQNYPGLFFRDIFTNYSLNSFALVCNRPLTSEASIETYGTSTNEIIIIMKDLLKYLKKKGIGYVQFKLFNPKVLSCEAILEKTGLKMWKRITMVKNL